MTIAHLYITFPTLEAAQATGQALLEQKLIACANYHTIQSDYTWKEKIVSEGEIAASFKTLSHLEAEARAVIEKLHSYDIPLIASFEMKVNSSYYTWMMEVCK